MHDPITTLKPRKLWQYFYQFTQTPRPSFEEEAIQQFVLDEAERLGLWAERDAVGNVLIRKPATAGMEDAPVLILQNHLDMVAQKNDDCTHDFSTDAIDAYIDGEWVTANGTTLGADNGIGAAAVLAVLASTDIAHGPIEALFTATEETGMLGAKGLQANWLKGEILINLDTEHLGDICIGCAGGIDATFTLPIDWKPVNYSNAYQLSVRGLKGGHSGVDIIKQRGNAAIIINRLLDSVSDEIEVASINGGNLRNAIPREAVAVFASDLLLAELNQQLSAVIKIIRRGLPTEDREFSVSLEATKMPEQCWTRNTQHAVLTAIRLCPNGVDRMSMETDGVVETSLSLAKIITHSNSLETNHLIRSLDDDARDDLANRLSRLFQTFGANAEFTGAYPGWQPQPGAAITDLVINEGKKVLGKTPAVTVIHAGLECGILGKNYPNWQMASFGPSIEMPHSPDERVHIKSVELFWQWLVQVLGALKTA